MSIATRPDGELFQWYTVEVFALLTGCSFKTIVKMIERKELLAIALPPPLDPHSNYQFRIREDELIRFGAKPPEA
jgi:hypothetical protein